VHVIEERDSSKADEQSVYTTKSSATRSRAVTVRSVNYIISIYKINLRLNSQLNTLISEVKL